jgi:hypothetical protein
MESCRVLASSGLVAFCLMFDGARAQVVARPGAEIAVAIADRMTIATASPADLVFDDDFDGQKNGGTCCAAATPLAGGVTYGADTTAAPNWMTTFGPLFSPSNDVVYVFVAGPDVQGSIVPTASNYDFAMYLITSCVNSGGELPPIGATATLGHGIDLSAAGVISGDTYYLAITGTASGGPGANGTLNFTTPSSLISPAPRF